MHVPGVVAHVRICRKNNQASGQTMSVSKKRSFFGGLCSNEDSVKDKQARRKLYRLRSR